MNKKCIVIQNGYKECGSACLLSIIRYYKGNIELNKLVELTKTDKNGTNFYNMSEAIIDLGLQSKSYHVDNFEQLLSIGKPFICQLLIDGYYHFVVVYKIGNTLTIMDPAKGRVNMPKSEFLKLFTGYILIPTPYRKIPYIKEENYITKVVADTITNNYKLILKLIILSILSALITSICAFHLKIIIDIIDMTDKNNILIITTIFLSLSITKAIINFIRNKLIIYFNQKIDISLLTTAFNKILLLPYSYYKNKTTGEITSRINDLTNVKNIIIKFIINVFLDIPTFIIGAFILILINKTLFIYLILTIIGYLLIFNAFKYNTKKMTNLVQEESAKTTSMLVESIAGYETIKGLNYEKEFNYKLDKLYLKLLQHTLSFDSILNIQGFLKELIDSIINPLMIYVGSIMILNNSLNIGMLVAFISLSSLFLNPIKNGIDLYNDYCYIKNSLKRANDLFNCHIEQLDKSDLKIKGNIVFDNVYFKYSNNDILNNINFNINQGEKVLVIGSSGNGKSTILKLINKYYNIERNKIFIDNIDINDYSLGDIRSNITYVPQEEKIFTDTIRNNIIIGKVLSQSEFIKICNLVSIDEIVKDNMLGYDMLLEEGGANISGGQRQRIALARALVRNSKIIMIDEGLSQMDINLERKILKNIFNNYKSSTIIIVSHRLDNMDLYDKVIRVEKGKSEVLERND